MLSDEGKLHYLLKGIDIEATPLVGKWLCDINQIYKNYSKNNT